MENIEKELGRFLLHIKPVKNNLEYIINIIMLKDELCKLLKVAENKLKADFSTDLFINYIKTDKIFGYLDLYSIEFTYKNEMYVVYNFNEKIKIEKIWGGMNGLDKRVKRK